MGRPTIERIGVMERYDARRPSPSRRTRGLVLAPRARVCVLFVGMPEQGCCVLLPQENAE